MPHPWCHAVLCSPSWLALSPCWPQIYSCLPPDLLTSVPCIFQSNPECFFANKNLITSVPSWHCSSGWNPALKQGMQSPVQSTCLESSLALPSTWCRSRYLLFFQTTQWTFMPGIFPRSFFCLAANLPSEVRSLSIFPIADRHSFLRFLECDSYWQWSCYSFIVYHPLTRVKAHGQQESEGFVFIFPGHREGPMYISLNRMF